MSDNWVVQNLENALNTWNEKLTEIWQLITQVMVGGMISIVTMCLVQINRYRGTEDYDYTPGNNYEDADWEELYD